MRNFVRIYRASKRSVLVRLPYFSGVRWGLVVAGNERVQLKVLIIHRPPYLAPQSSPWTVKVVSSLEKLENPSDNYFEHCRSS